MSAVNKNDSLKQQFQQLQEQQQKKLLRRKQLKDEKGKGDRQASADTVASTAFGVNDDLDLKLADPPTNSGSIYSEDLVEHLNDEIRELKDETGRLYKLLSERDLEVRQLKKKQQDGSALAAVVPSGVTSDTAATKIVELSKKLREMTAELESERTKSKQFAKKCFNLENELQNAINSSSLDMGKGKSGQSLMGSKMSMLDDITDHQAVAVELKRVQEKVKQTEMKMAEFRNQTLSLKQELKVANKIISQEVGEGSTVQSLSNNTGNWRGRAQQIIMLQKRVNELQSRLDDSTRHEGQGTVADHCLGSPGARTTRNAAEERQKDQLRKMEKERKESQEKMANELKTLEQDHQTLKHKMEASKARNKVISTELKSAKHQIQTLLEKGKHDDELISALLKQQEKLKTALEQNTRSQVSSQHQEEEVKRQLAQRTQQENNVIEQLRVIVAEKEVKVKALEEEIIQMRLQKAQLNGVSAIFDHNLSESSQHSNSANQLSGRSVSSCSTSAAMNRPSTVNCISPDDLGTITPVPSSRLGDIRTASRQSARETPEPERSRRSSARPHSATGADRKALDDLHLQCQEYKSLCQASTVERDRLTEFVQVLQKRTDELSQKVTEAQTELVSQRRKNAQLEKQLGKAKVEQQGVSAKKQKPRLGASAVSLRESVTLDEDGRGPHNLEELETSLAIQKDENEALKMALQSTLQSKEEDLRLYSEMIEETKKVFLQGLRQYRGQT